MRTRTTATALALGPAWSGDDSVRVGEAEVEVAEWIDDVKLPRGSRLIDIDGQGKGQKIWDQKKEQERAGRRWGDKRRTDRLEHRGRGRSI